MTPMRWRPELSIDCPSRRTCLAARADKSSESTGTEAYGYLPCVPALHNYKSGSSKEDGADLFCSNVQLIACTDCGHCHRPRRMMTKSAVKYFCDQHLCRYLQVLDASPRNQSIVQTKDDWGWIIGFRSRYIPGRP